MLARESRSAIAIAPGGPGAAKSTGVDSDAARCPLLFVQEHHTHVFVPQSHGTLMIDVFTFRAPLGVLGRLAEILFLTRYMTGLLLTRNRYLKQVAESGTEPSPLSRS